MLLDNIEIIKQYIPIAEFISQILGENSEVVLHDISDPEHSIIAIMNEHISGRKIGGPITDLLLKVIQSKSYKNKNYIVNYKSSAKHKTFRSSSFFIKDDNEEIIGVICVNTDIEPYERVKNLMDKMTFIERSFDSIGRTQIDYKNEDEVKEKLCTNVDDLLGSMINDAITNIGVLPKRMSVEEKMDVVNQLDSMGAFRLKGAVNEIAKAIDVSEPTVYRYLSKCKE